MTLRELLVPPPAEYGKPRSSRQGRHAASVRSDRQQMIRGNGYVCGVVAAEERVRHAECLAASRSL